MAATTTTTSAAAALSTGALSFPPMRDSQYDLSNQQSDKKGAHYQERFGSAHPAGLNAPAVMARSTRMTSTSTRSSGPNSAHATTAASEGKPRTSVIGVDLENESDWRPAELTPGHRTRTGLSVILREREKDRHNIPSEYPLRCAARLNDVAMMLVLFALFCDSLLPPVLH